MANTGIPALGDRAAFDAEEYPEKHANDIDEAGGMHHTLGTGENQAAAGNHTHAQLHDAVTVVDGTTVDLDLDGQEITAEVIPAAINAADLASGAAGDGQVLTADGAGGAAWEDPAGGAGAFTDLTDVPSSYSGQANKLVRVNAGATALEFTAPPAGTGDVVGPASATDGNLAVFDGATGKLIKDGGAPGGGSTDVLMVQVFS